MNEDDKLELRSRRARAYFDYKYADFGGWAEVMRRLGHGDPFIRIAPDLGITPQRLGEIYENIEKQRYSDVAREAK